jgi:hypothetical protein
METPTVGIIAPYGTTYGYGLINTSVKEGLKVLAIVETNDAVNAYKNTFGLVDKVEFIDEKEALRRLIDDCAYPKRIQDIELTLGDHIFYFLPNRLHYSLNAYVFLKVLEYLFFENVNIPKVTLIGVNTGSIPPISSHFTIFNKYSDEIPIDLQLMGKPSSEDIYDEMAKLILRIHMETPLQKIVAIVPGYTEAETLKGLLYLNEIPKMRVRNIYDKGFSSVPIEDEEVTTVYVAGPDVLSLVMVDVDVVVDSYLIKQPTVTLSGEKITNLLPCNGNISISRSSILQNNYEGDTAKPCYVFSSLSSYYRSLDVTEGISDYMLMLGNTTISFDAIFPDKLAFNNKVLELQSYGALNPSLRVTKLGKWIQKIPLSPSEATVLWLWLQDEELSKEFSCLPAMITTITFSSFLLDSVLFIYPPSPEERVDYFYQKEQHRRKAWKQFVGTDDIETLLKIWYFMFADLDTFRPSYDDVLHWAGRNSLNGDFLWNVIQKIDVLRQILEDEEGYDCGTYQIDTVLNIKALRPIYSKVYALKTMKYIEPNYQNTTTQELFTIDSDRSVNSLEFTTPSHIVAPVTHESDIIFAVIRV